MHEFLGIILGAAIGSGLAMTRPRRLQAALLFLSALAAGVLTSAINGELQSSVWTIFVTFDSLLATFGCLLGALLAPRLARRRLRRPTLTRSSSA